MVLKWWVWFSPMWFTWFDNSVSHIRSSCSTFLDMSFDSPPLIWSTAAVDLTHQDHPVMESNVVHKWIPAVVWFIAVWADMTQTWWFCLCPWRQRILHVRTTHLLTYAGGHSTGALLCWQWIFNICTPQWKYVTGSSKPNMVSGMHSAWIGKVLDGMNSWKECTVNFDEPRQISCGNTSFRCVRVHLPLTTLQSWSIDQSNICVEVDVGHLLTILEHIEETH